MSATTDGLRIAVSEPRTWARRLRITVPADWIERERRETARRLAKEIRMPGFRKGKVPPSVIERNYGAKVEQEAVERVVREAYRAALRQENLQPISEAEIDNLDYQPGTDLRFDVEFEIRPVIELERVGGFTLKREARPVGDADVDSVLESLRRERADWVPIDGSPASGHRVRIEITPLDPPDAETRPYEFVLGEGQAIPEIETAIQTLELGGESEVELPPDDAGNKRRIRLDLIGASRPEPPSLDDEFARGLGDFEDLAALRERIRSDLVAEAKAESERQLHREVLDRIIEANPFEVPDGMIDQYLDHVMPQREGIGPERLAEAKRNARPAAEHAIKRRLVVERVAAMESLQATRAEVDAKIREIAERGGRAIGQVKAQLRKANRLAALEDEVTENKVFDYLLELSNVE